MTKQGLALILCGWFATTTACMTFELEGDGVKTEASAHGSEVVHGSLYSISWSSREIEKCVDGAGIYRVEYYTNGLYLLAQTLTLGLWVPQSVEWWCQDATWQDEDDGELLSLDDEFPGQED